MSLLKKAKKAVKKTVAKVEHAVSNPVAATKKEVKAIAANPGKALGFVATAGLSQAPGIGKHVTNLGKADLGYMVGASTLGFGNQLFGGLKDDPAFRMGGQIGRGVDIAAGVIGGGYLLGGALGAGGLGAGGLGAGGMVTPSGFAVNGLAGMGMMGAGGAGGGMGLGGMSLGNLLGLGAMGYGLYGQNQANKQNQKIQKQYMNAYNQQMQNYQNNMAPIQAGYGDLMNQIQPFGAQYQQISNEAQNALAGNFGGRGWGVSDNPAFGYQSGKLQAELAAQELDRTTQMQYNILGAEGNLAGQLPNFALQQYPYFPNQADYSGLTQMGAGMAFNNPYFNQPIGNLF